jgi:hypothetical protein
MGLPTRIEVLAISLSCGLGDRATLFRPLGNWQSWLVYCTSRLPTSGFVGQNYGCRIAGPPTLPQNRLWVVPCLGALQTAGHRSVEVLAQTLGLPGSIP